MELGEGLRQELTLGRVGDRLYAQEAAAGPMYALPAAFADLFAALFADPWPAAAKAAAGTGGKAADR